MRMAKRMATMGVVLATSALWSLRPAAAGDFTQNRAMGGVGVAVVADESAIEVNPAGLSQLARYSVGFLYSHADTNWSMGVAVLDSKTSPIAMGVDYRFTRVFEKFQAGTGYDKLNTLRLAVGEFYADKVNFGLGYEAKFFHPDVTTEARTTIHNVNLGLIFPLNDWFRLGLSVNEFIPFKDQPRDPRATLGLGFSPHKAVVLSLDAVGHWDSGRGARDWDVVFGMELIALDQIGLRFGYGVNPDRGNFDSFSTGIGWFFPRGHMGYSYNTEARGTDRHTVSFTINVL